MGTKTDLAGIVSDIVAYFQTKPPHDRTIDLWLKKLDGLNLRASRARIVDIITNGDAAPRNFPAAVKSAYSTWLRDQPREKQEGGCDLCLQGLIHARKEGNVYVFRCDHCNSSTASAIPAMTRYQLEEQGYKLDWQHEYHGPGNMSVKEQIKAMVRTIPERREESGPELLLLKRLREQKPQIDEDCPF
jgi:hypothetical protein